MAHLVGPVHAAFPQYLAEMEGIAEGAGLDVADIFTMNARTEMMWAATARQAEADRAAFSRECSSFALLPQRTASGHTLIGQTWDWLSHSFDTLVVLEVEQDDRPNFVTVVEAGLLAKTSMNSSGLAVAVNSLVTSADKAEPGLPFHVLIRAFADCDTLTDAIYIVSKHQRSSSGNYLLAHADGLAVNLETTPGDYRGVTPQLPSRGALVHTNHFVSPVPGSQDVGHYAMADSLIRLQRVAAQIADNEGASNRGRTARGAERPRRFPGSGLLPPRSSQRRRSSVGDGRVRDHGPRRESHVPQRGQPMPVPAGAAQLRRTARKAVAPGCNARVRRAS